MPAGNGEHDITALSQVLAVVEHEAAIPPHPDPVLALLGELKEANAAARRNREAYDAAVTEGFPDYADVGPGKRWPTPNDLPEDLLERYEAATKLEPVVAIGVKSDGLSDQYSAIELRIAATSGCSSAGALAKLRIIVQSWRDPGDPEIPPWDKMDLDDKLVASAMRDLECVMGERPAL